MNRLMIFLATGFGLGRSPFASGTVGSLPGLALVAVMAPLSVGWQAVLAALLAAAAIPVCEVAEEHFRKKDDRRIVADEYLTFPICMLGIPWVLHPWMLAVGFVVSRVMDIVKPPPARQAQALYGGLGIVLDDVASSLYALLVNHVVLALVQRWTG